RPIRDFNNYAWTASDLVQKHSRQQLYPLIDKLLKRAIYIFKRLGRIAEQVVTVRRRNRRMGKLSPTDDYVFVSPESLATSINGLKGGYGMRPSSGPAIGARASIGGVDVIDNVEEFPYFIQKVRELFDTFVAHAIQLCREKCMDEFYTTRL